MFNLGRENTPSAPVGGGSVAQGLSLVKGERVSLTKGNGNLNEIHVGLGWDVNQTGGADFDLDASVFMLGASEKVENQLNFVFFNNLKSPDGSVRHTGDNLTGEGDGDDESIKVSLSKVPANVQKLVFTVTIYQARERRQNFGQVSNAFIRIVDESTGAELLRFDLTEDYSHANSVIVGEIYRHNNEWKFNAVGNGVQDEIDGLVSRYM